jgi:glutaminyl-tRNA synthetase
MPIPAEFRLYDRLFTVPNPDEGDGYLTNLNPQSLEKVSGLIESAMKQVPVGSHFQFERQGYFCVDPDSSQEKPVFNRSVSLKDSWAKIEAQ